MSRSARFVLLSLVVAAAANARVISYAPYTDRVALPAVQNRLNRHFVLIEQAPATAPAPASPLPPNPFAVAAQLVLYDSKGLEEPRVIYPQDGSAVAITVAAAREEANVVSILIQTTDSHGSPSWMLTPDSGATWLPVALPGNLVTMATSADTGGAFARSKYSQVRVGTKAVPFVVNTGTAFYTVGAFGGVNQVAMTGRIAGSDREGRRFLFVGTTAVQTVDLDFKVTTLSTAKLTGQVEGWITPDDEAYIGEWENTGQVILWKSGGGALTPVVASWDGPVTALPPINPSWVMFAVPTADYSGAWVIKEGGGRSTTLYLHNAAGLMTQWADVSAPQVEALHTAQSGTKLLIQVHRPRQSVDNLQFKDPALAIWRMGEPAPASYDELFLSETTAKGFVHLNADAVESGDPFVFDSGTFQFFIGCNICTPPPTASPAGGSDVVQEWGVVRASLQQKLALPGVGHAAGAFGSQWATDVTLYNPGDSAEDITLDWRPNALLYFDPLPPQHLILGAHEIRVIADIAKSLFGVDNGTGLLFITPPASGGVNATARTYNTTSAGTYGFTMNGIDVFTAVGPRFPLTFSGAFLGSSFRTNLVVADVSGRGTSVNASTAGPDGAKVSSAASFDALADGQMQFNSIGPQLAVAPSETGALVLQPSRGETLAGVFVVDNQTNDPTYFPPDIPASVMRVIPAIGHVDGANGSKFRSDLFLFNNSSQVKTVTLQAKLWDVPENPTIIPLTLLPHEARIIHDVLQTAFGKTGIARLRFTLQGSVNDTSVRVTSRTYTVDQNGGTYGFLMPPLNSFQSGSSGDTLEILGATLDPHFRANLGLVDLAGFPSGTAPRARIDIVDDQGKTIDSFERDVPSAGGVQINDLFHARALPESTKPVLIRVTTIQGMIGAYGAFVDNGTNDPAYVAANLAAKN